MSATIKIKTPNQLVTGDMIHIDREEKSVLLRALKAQLIPFDNRVGEKILDGHLGEKQMELLEKVLSDSLEIAKRESDPKEMRYRLAVSYGNYILKDVTESANALADIRQGQADDLTGGLSLIRQIKQGR